MSWAFPGVMSILLKNHVDAFTLRFIVLLPWVSTLWKESDQKHIYDQDHQHFYIITSTVLRRFHNTYELKVKNRSRFLKK